MKPPSVFGNTKSMVGRRLLPTWQNYSPDIIMTKYESLRNCRLSETFISKRIKIRERVLYKERSAGWTFGIKADHNFQKNAPVSFVTDAFFLLDQKV